MNIKGIESVLSRAMSDAAFTDLLFADPEKALAGFDLTAEEIKALKSMSRADFAAISHQPEERKSMKIYSSSPNHNETVL